MSVYIPAISRGLSTGFVYTAERQDIRDTHSNCALLSVQFTRFRTQIQIHLFKQESPAVADKPARRLRKVCTVYVIAVGL